MRKVSFSIPTHNDVIDLGRKAKATVRRKLDERAEAKAHRAHADELYRRAQAAREAALNELAAEYLRKAGGQ